MVKLRQMAGWVPSVQGPGRGLGLNTLKVINIYNWFKNVAVHIGQNMEEVVFFSSVVFSRMAA